MIPLASIFLVFPTSAGRYKVFIVFCCMPKPHGEIRKEKLISVQLLFSCLKKMELGEYVGNGGKSPA